MPTNQHLMNDLIVRYGATEAEHVYWGMVGEAKGPFAAGEKYHQEHIDWARRNGVAPLGTKRKARLRRR